MHVVTIIPPSISNMLGLFKLRWSFSFVLSLLILATKALGNIHLISSQKWSHNSIPSIFVFGDSTVDPGNNNFIRTASKSDFPPYGVDFPNHTPTGRFTNGRLATDFIASYMGVKETIPAYLDPMLSLEDLITGVSFASGGSGYDPLTNAKDFVIDPFKQLEYFDEYKKRLEDKIGKKRMEEIVKSGVYIVSIGTNDIFDTFGMTPKSAWLTSYAPTYLHFLLKRCKRFLQGLFDRGARKIGVVSLPPVGCLPAVITLHSSLHEPRKCVDFISSIAKDYNKMLQAELKAMQASQTNYLVAYGDIYGPLDDQITNPQKYGFEVVDRGCCGTGIFEGGLTCNFLTPLCNNRSNYIFWDVIHPTERSYHLLFEFLRPLVDLLLHGHS